MVKLQVQASKNYDVIINDNFDELNRYVKNVYKGSKILIVSDDNVFPLYGEKVKKELAEYSVFEYVIKAGEKSKNIENFTAICEYLADNLFSRKDCILALGGGVVGDLAGFVASSFMRGINFIQCPTTLLSAVDSSVGGKTAINLKSGKNLVGAIYQPLLVYLATSTLKSLPEKEITNGMGEIIKYAFLSSAVTKEMIKSKDFSSLIYNSIKIKADIVNKDEFEGGIRAVLNLGHTIGHAIENLSNYELSHGLAVIKGINKIIDVSAKYYNLSQEKVDKMRELLSVYPSDVDQIYSNAQILSKIKNDKKVSDEYVNAILIKDIGNVEIVKTTLKHFGELIG